MNLGCNILKTLINEKLSKIVQKTTWRLLKTLKNYTKRSIGYIKRYIIEEKSY